MGQPPKVEEFVLPLVAALAGLVFIAPALFWISVKKAPEEYEGYTKQKAHRFAFVSGCISATCFFIYTAFPDISKSIMIHTSQNKGIRLEHLLGWVSINVLLLGVSVIVLSYFKRKILGPMDLSKNLF